jgi:hypothetical protein
MHYPECSSPPLLAYLMSAVPRSVRRARAILADSESTRETSSRCWACRRNRCSSSIPAPSRACPGPADDEATAAVLARYGIRRPYICRWARYSRARITCGSSRPIPPCAASAACRTSWSSPRPGLAGSGDRHRHRRRRPGGPGAPGGLCPPTPTCRRSIAPPTCSLFRPSTRALASPILEALGCGTPVVAGNTSSLPGAPRRRLAGGPVRRRGIVRRHLRLLDDPLYATISAQRFEQVRRLAGHRPPNNCWPCTHM